MPLGNGMMQRRLAGAIGGIQRAAVLQQQVDHGHRAHGRGTVQGVLAALVAHAGRGRRGVLLEQPAGHVEIGLGGEEMESGL